MTSVKISGERHVGKCKISQHTVTLISMDHGIKARTHTIEKSHNSRLGNCPDICLIVNYVISQWVRVLAILCLLHHHVNLRSAIAAISTKIVYLIMLLFLWLALSQSAQSSQLWLKSS